MTQFYPNPPGDGIALYFIRLLVGSAMAISIVMGMAAIRQRDISAHSAWMTPHQFCRIKLLGQRRLKWPAALAFTGILKCLSPRA